jgi:hypothetical protein
MYATFDYLAPSPLPHALEPFAPTDYLPHWVLKVPVYVPVAVNGGKHGKHGGGGFSLPEIPVIAAFELPELYQEVLT